MSAMGGAKSRLAELPGAGIIVRSPTGTLLVRAGALLGSYFVLEWWLLGVARLPEAGYHESVLVLEALERMVAGGRGATSGLVRLAIAAAVALATVRFFPRLRVGWAALEDGRRLQSLALVAAGILAWAGATYDYNLYYDQGHLLDRALLLVLFALVVWRPIFVLPFVALSMLLVWQVHYPIGRDSVAESFVLVRILILYAAALLLRGVTGRFASRELLFLAVIVLAASYLRCGIGKALLGWPEHAPFNWLTHGHIHFLTFATYANGWLGFWDPDSMTRFARAVERLDPLLVGATIVLECGALLVFFRRWILLAFLAGWVGFHLGVFAVSGILFWKWILIELTLLATFLLRGGSRAFPVFERRYFLLSIPLLIGGAFWFRPVNLTWYDSPVSYAYRFEAVGEGGSRYSLPPSFFAPYDYQFTMGNFHYLAEHPNLGVVWGAIWDRDRVERLMAARTGAEVLELERAEGRSYYDGAKTATLLRFLERFVGTYNARGSKTTPLSVLEAPPHLVSFARDDAFRGQEGIRRVTVEQVTTFYDGERYREIRTRELHAVEIPPARP